MKGRLEILALVGVSVAVACCVRGAQVAMGPAGSGSEAAAPPVSDIPDEPQPEPEQIVAIAAVRDPVASARSLVGAAEALGVALPRAGVEALLDAMLAEVLGAPVAGLDHRRPLRVLVLEPGAGAAVVVVAALADEAALHRELAGSPLRAVAHEGHVAVGLEEPLRAIAPFALSTLIHRAAPPRPTLSVRPARLRAALGGELDRQMAALKEAAGGAARAVAMALLSESDELQLALDGAGGLTIEVTAMAAPGTTLDEISASQGPATFALARLHVDAPVLIAGRLVTGGLPEPVRRFLAEALRPGDAGEGAALLRRWYRLTGGEVGVSLGGLQRAPWSVIEWETRRPEEARELVREMAAAGFGVPSQFEVKLDSEAFRRGGVAVDRVLVRPRRELDETRRVALERRYGTVVVPSFTAVFPDRVQTAVGRDARRRSERMVDYVTGERRPPMNPAVAEALDGARSRGESLIALVAPAQLPWRPPGLSGPVALGVGFYDGFVTLRLTVPLDDRRLTRDGL